MVRSPRSSTRDTATNADTARQFAVTRDGARMLAITVPIESRPRQIELVTHWTQELKRLVPGDAR